jgi:hypothetical protein
MSRKNDQVGGGWVRDNFHWRILRGLGKLFAWSVSIRNPSKEHGMNPTAQVAPEKFVETMKDEIEQYAKDVMEAVNDAPDGAWIAGSEEQVRDLSAEMRRKVFGRALQEWVDAAEAAFPPSAPSYDGQAAGQ